MFRVWGLGFAGQGSGFRVTLYSYLRKGRDIERLRIVSVTFRLHADIKIFSVWS